MQENKTVLFTREHKTLYAQGDKVIKVFDSNYKKSDVLNEARNEALVQENSDLNVPSLSSVSESEEGWCLIRDKVEGVTLAELMQQHPEKMEEYMELFVDLQLQVHKQRVPSIKTLRHKLMDQINSLKEIDATARYELASRLQGMPRHTKLCHGDFNPSNVIVAPDGKLWVIDWAHAAQGNASADAAMTYLLFALESSEQAEQYIRLFCKKADIARQYVNRWLPIVAAAQLTKKKEQEKEILPDGQLPHLNEPVPSGGAADYRPADLPHQRVRPLHRPGAPGGDAEEPAGGGEHRYHVSWRNRGGKQPGTLPAHGKTTTTSMLAWILKEAGLEPGWLIGGVPQWSNQIGRASCRERV